MLIFAGTVLMIWLLSWVAWFFCTPGTKWFDNCIQDDEDMYVLPLMATVISAIGIGGMTALSYYPASDNVPFVLCFICTVISLCGWLWMFAYYCLVEVHAELRRKRNY